MVVIELPTFADVEQAARRIDGHVVRTPVIRSAAVDEAVGHPVWLKCETFQHAGAFKFRGAANAVLSLSDEEASRGVAAHSSGNHAAALALAARRRGVPAVLVMPHDAPMVKQEAVRRAGGSIVWCDPSMQARVDTLAQVLIETGATEIHPYDDPRVIAGAGSAALELVDDIPDLDLVIAPVSGGGLLSGTALAAQGRRPGMRVWGAEPSGVDDAYRSLITGRRHTDNTGTSMADGLLATLSDRTFAILRERVETIVVVTEEEIAAATELLICEAKLVVEASAAVAVAALIRRRDDLPSRVGVILSGGNVDLDRLPF